MANVSMRKLLVLIIVSNISIVVWISPLVGFDRYCYNSRIFLEEQFLIPSNSSSNLPGSEQTIFNKNVTMDKTNSPRNDCQCKLKSKSSQVQEQASSMCSYEASLLGGNQRVVSFTLFSKFGSNLTNIQQRYFNGILENLGLMKKFYPGWVMRVYTNFTLTPSVCAVVCADEALYFCNVTHLPILGDVQNLNPTNWRFLVLGDPTVEKLICRDLDSRLNPREKDAVDEWERSKFPFHAMRDHPSHRYHVMAGMWGANIKRLDKNIALEIQRKILNATVSNFNGTDQNLLSIVLYQPYKQKILIHDSYSCETLHDSVGFPTKRQNNRLHVGGKFNNLHPVAECPKACRPKHGSKWQYC